MRSEQRRIGRREVTSVLLRAASSPAWRSHSEWPFLVAGFLVWAVADIEGRVGLDCDSKFVDVKFPWGGEGSDGRLLGRGLDLTIMGSVLVRRSSEMVVSLMAYSGVRGKVIALNCPVIEGVRVAFGAVSCCTVVRVYVILIGHFESVFSRVFHLVWKAIVSK